MNKSKFLKKSLAMLLALMLVFAMIPLSASAAELPNIEYLYVEGNQVDLEKTMTVDVREGDTTLTVGTNIDLTQYDVEMYAAIMEEGVPQYKLIENNGTTGTTFSGTGVDALSRWAPEDVMTLEVYPIDGPKDDALLARYTLNLNRTQANVTTNLKDVKAVEGSGVYSIDNTIEEINATRTIKVTAAYGTNANGPKIKVYTADEATVNSKTEDEVSAANDAKFEVVSESKNNTAEFKVETTYVDSLTSFSVNGVKGEITDESNPQDDHNDTITVTLPKDAVLDEYGERLAAEDINFKVEYAIYAKTGTLNFTGDSKWITSGTEVNFGDLATSDEYSKDITTKVIGDVTQTYTLNVQLEKDTDTSIDRVVIKAGPGVEEVARPNGKEINVEVPSNATDTGTVDIYTPTTVTRVAVAGTNVTTVTIENNLKKWTISGVNLTTPKTITVTAENNSIQEYTLTVTKATEVKEPAIESFSIENPETGKVYSGTPDDKRVIEIKVPYMTLNVADWVVRVTPADGTNVLTYAGYAIPSGQYKVSAVSATTAVDVTNGLSFTVDAVAKGNTTDSKTYTVKVVLEEPGSGKTLETLEFTSQTGTDDETVFRALNDDNTFDAKIDQSKKTITLSPALSLAQTGYYHYVTGFTTAKGGVAFVAINGNTLCYEVPAVTSDEDDTAPVTGFELGSGKTPTANHSIIVVPEAIARKAELGGAVSGGSGYALSNLTADEQKSITEYNFVIDPAPALKEADLKTFKIGDVELKVSGNTISGELPWSYTYASATAPNAKFAEFTMGKYAMMYDDGNQPYYSNGDVNGDGEAEDRDANNNGFVFVRGTKDNEVLVYRADKGSVSTSPIESVTVKAEDRLNTGTDKTSKTYDFELKYADPEINANIDSFKLGKYEGTISGTNINVRVPYNTDLKGMIATFTTSTGATVYYNTKAEANKVESGKTVLNYSSPVKLVVHSEKTKGDVVGADSVTVKTYTVTVTEAEMFSDVSSSKWYYDYVLQASNLGIINGKGDGIFAPEEDVTRGDFAVMLTNMLGVTELPHVVNNPFADVNEDIYYSDAIAYCYEQGYIGGYPDGSYRPEATITRQEAAKIIAEALELTETDSDPFTDDNLIHEWAEDYVYQCKAAGIFGGDAGTGNFRPTDAISRAETAKIMVVAHNNK